MENTDKLYDLLCKVKDHKQNCLNNFKTEYQEEINILFLKLFNALEKAAESGGTLVSEDLPDLFINRQDKLIKVLKDEFAKRFPSDTCMVKITIFKIMPRDLYASGKIYIRAKLKKRKNKKRIKILWKPKYQELNSPKPPI